MIQYRSVVKEIRKTANGVRVIYSQNGAERAILADYCIAALPVNAMKGIENDFSPQVKKAIEDARYSDSYRCTSFGKRYRSARAAWISGASGEYYKGPYRAFLEPDDRIYFAGEIFDALQHRRDPFDRRFDLDDR